jgi:sigma-B regulation protein RsbU (phosphoserine phosphatase)
MMTVNASQPPADRLALLYRLSQTFNASIELDEVLNRVMDEVIAVTHAERGFVMLREPGGDLTFRVARGMDQNTIQQPQFQVSRSVVERVAREGDPILTSDAQSDERFSRRESVVALRLRSILCAPLRIKDTISGVIYVDNRLQAGIFTQADLELLTSIAYSAAIAIENARLYQVAVDKGRMERELQMAYDVQVALLPSETPNVPGWEFGAVWRPAREVAGDYYDFIPADNDALGMVIADVSDKGMPAALFMALTRSTIRASVGHSRTPADDIAHANRLICADASRGMFVTLFYALLNPKTGALTYVNAGHNPPILFTAETKTLTTLQRTAMALGVHDEALTEQRTIHLSDGDFILFYTDGVTDAENNRGERFGTERLQQIIAAECHATAREIADHINEAVGDFTGERPLFDDVTIMVIKCLKRLN